MNPNLEEWWAIDATLILDYIEAYRGLMSDFELMEDIMSGAYADKRLRPFLLLKKGVKE